MTVDTGLQQSLTPLSQILSVARAGSPSRAWALFVAEGWDRQTDDPKALTLKGRLLKDQAKALIDAPDRGERDRLYGEAAAAYAAAAEIRTDSYPLINAAALALLGGDPERSAELAAQVLALIESDPDEGENAYWREATRAEALLLMGHEEEARQSLADAIAKLPDAWEDHAATIGQFALILFEQGCNTGWLDQHRPPPSVHFSGMIRLQPDDSGTPEAIRQFIENEQPGFAYGALAAGSDLLFAQAFLDNKQHHRPAAELHVILPFPIEQFRELSVSPFGDQWLLKFDAVLGQAETVTILGLDDPPLTLAVEVADRMAMGQAVRNASNLQSSAKAMTVAGSDEQLSQQLAFWQISGRELIVVEGQRKPTAVGEFEPEETSKSMGTLIWINNGKIAALKDMLGGAVHLRAHKNGHWFTLDNQEKAFLLAIKITRTDQSDVQISMLHGIMDMDAPSIDLLQRAQTFASVSQSGVITTDKIGAMALTLINVGRSIEEIGELKTVWGSQPLWRIT